AESENYRNIGQFDLTVTKEAEATTAGTAQTPTQPGAGTGTIAGFVSFGQLGGISVVLGLILILGVLGWFFLSRVNVKENMQYAPLTYRK
ncbi:MAG: hypothetical protein Q7K42_01520, partial [Candidatus Diapherotrites archaeon]|nr:hypothetical protein [Candidatus Diapherotrites archaeon]